MEMPDWEGRGGYESKVMPLEKAIFVRLPFSMMHKVVNILKSHFPYYVNTILLLIRNLKGDITNIQNKRPLAYTMGIAIEV